VFVHKLHDLSVEEGESVTLECHNNKISKGSSCKAPQFVTMLEDHEVRTPNHSMGQTRLNVAGAA